MAYRIGILISLLLLGIVILYLRKKEGWDWDKVVLILTTTLITILVCVSVGILVFIKVSVEPKVQTSFWDINLESSRPSIEFIKGTPVEVTDDGFWIYTSKIKGDAEIYFLRFKDDKLWLVGYLRGGSSGGPGIQGFKQGFRLDEITKFFGEPSQVVEVKLNLSKLYLYEKYNVFFVIKGNKVSFYGAYNSNKGPFIITDTFEKNVSQMTVD